jgi:hypothetical protein
MEKVASKLLLKLFKDLVILRRTTKKKVIVENAS